VRDVPPPMRPMLSLYYCFSVFSSSQCQCWGRTIRDFAFMVAGHGFGWGAWLLRSLLPFEKRLYIKKLDVLRSCSSRYFGEVIVNPYVPAFFDPVWTAYSRGIQVRMLKFYLEMQGLHQRKQRCSCSCSSVVQHIDAAFRSFSFEICLCF
jgi:hypothetical protein